MFHTSYKLNRHLQTVHTDAKYKAFQCQECGKGFSAKDTFNNHLNIHKGIKPFKCDFCETKFQNASNKIAHVKKIHPQMYTTQRVEVKVKDI